MDGDEIRVQPPTAYYLAHLISALDRVRAREESLDPTRPSDGSPEPAAGWDDPADLADILPFPVPPAAGWAVPMSA